MYRVAVNSFAINVGMADSSDEMEDVESMRNEIPNCEGLPQQMWNTKCVTLYNAERKLVGEGTCHSVKIKKAIFKCQSKYPSRQSSKIQRTPKR